MPEEILRRILRLTGYCVSRTQFDEDTATVKLWVRQDAADPLYICGGCGIGVRSTHGAPRDRWVRDLPWGAWKVWLGVEVYRVHCRRCGVKTERIEFLEGKHPYTRRFAEAVARDCEDAAVSRVAGKWGLAPQTVRRIEFTFACTDTR